MTLKELKEWMDKHCASLDPEMEVMVSACDRLLPVITLDEIPKDGPRKAPQNKAVIFFI